MSDVGSCNVRPSVQKFVDDQEGSVTSTSVSLVNVTLFASDKITSRARSVMKIPPYRVDMKMSDPSQDASSNRNPTR